MNDLIGNTVYARAVDVRTTAATITESENEVAVVLLLNDAWRIGWIDQSRVKEICKHSPMKISGRTDKIGDHWSGRRPVLEDPLCIEIALRPGNDSQIVGILGGASNRA